METTSPAGSREAGIRSWTKSRALAGFAAVSGLAVVPVVFLLPAYSSGETISENAGGWLFYSALFSAALLACVPLLVPKSALRTAGWICGVLLLLSAFVTVIGVFFVPAGVLLCVAAARQHAGSV